MLQTVCNTVHSVLVFRGEFAPALVHTHSDGQQGEGADPQQDVVDDEHRLDVITGGVLDDEEVDARQYPHDDEA